MSQASEVRDVAQWSSPCLARVMSCVQTSYCHKEEKGERGRKLWLEVALTIPFWPSVFHHGWERGSWGPIPTGETWHQKAALGRGAGRFLQGRSHREGAHAPVSDAPSMPKQATLPQWITKQDRNWAPWCTPLIPAERQVVLCNFQASLVYTACSRTVRDLVSKN